MILEYFNKLINSNETSPCFYIHKTKRNCANIYINKYLTKKEKEINKTVFNNTNKNLSVKHGKKLFFRFLKNNRAYEDYVRYCKRGRINIENIILHEFLNPFQRLNAFLMNYTNTPKKIIEKLYSLENDWQKFLKTTNFY
jgi:hypothetical protein